MDKTFLNIAIYALVNLFLFSSWYLFLFRKKHYLLFVDRLIGTFVLCLAQIIFTEVLLGVLFKRLFAIPLFLFNISISLIVLLLVITARRHRTLPLNFLKDVLLELEDESIRFFNIIKRDGVLLCVFSFFFISVCWMIFLGYLFPSYTWDALWYHLPIVGYILQSGAIKEIPVPSFINQFINIFPKNIELFFLWNIIFLKSDVITDLSQLLFTIIGVFTIYSIAVKLKVKEKYAVFSSLLFFFTPIIILQSTTNYVDVAISVLFLVAVNFLMHDDPEKYKYTTSETGLVHQRERRIPIFLFGLTTGILLGSKGSGPLFVIVLLSVIVIQGIIRHLNLFGLMPSENKGYFMKDSFMPYLIYFIGPILLLGGYWYIKNWVLYNNPVYPMEVSIFNITLFKGLYGEIIEPVPEVIDSLSPPAKLLYVWMERLRYYLYDSRLGGFGPIWFVLFLPSLVFSFFYSIRRKKYKFLFISIILIITFLIHPRNWNTRYVIFVVGLGALSFGTMLDYFNEKAKALKIIALLLAGYTFFTANSPCVMPYKIKEFLNLSTKERTIARHAPFNIDLQARQEYGLWMWIDNNIIDGNVLAYTFEPLFLSPLWNRGFTSKIVYVKSDNFNDWVEELKQNQATHVLIRQNSTEDKGIQKFKKLIYNTPSWLGLTDHFKVVYSDKNYKVLRFQY